MNVSETEKTVYLSFDNTIKSTYKTFDDAAEGDITEETLEDIETATIPENAIKVFSKKFSTKMEFTSSTPQKHQVHGWKMESFAAVPVEEDKENSIGKPSVNNSTLTPNTEKSLILKLEDKQNSMKLMNLEEKQNSMKINILEEKQVENVANFNVDKKVTEVNFSSCNIPTQTVGPTPSEFISKLKPINRDPRLNENRKKISEEEDIPKLLDKLLHISTTTNKPNEKPQDPFQSKLKRPFPTLISKRLSIAVKTTINSPARKIPRRSVMPTFQRKIASSRHSILPSKLDIPSSSAVNMRTSLLPSKSNSNVRKSLMPPKPVNPNLRKSIAPPSTTNSSALPRRPTLMPSKLSTVATNKNKTIDSFTCNECGLKFRIKSLYDAHMRSHEKDITPMTRKASFSSTSSNTSSSGQCKYCDKTFALIRTLHIHLMNNCPKIPPGEKRKLQYTEMNHVEKAQLPSVPVIAAKKVIKKVTAVSSFNKIMTEKKTILDSTDSSKSTTSIQSQQLQGPPTASKLKNLNAHSGLYRTPNKNVPCHMCKQSFKNVLDYTNHCLNMHSAISNKDMGDGKSSNEEKNFNSNEEMLSKCLKEMNNM